MRNPQPCHALTQHRHKGLLAIGSMILSCLLFALMGVFVKLASAYFSTGELVFYRSLIGVLLMLFIVWIRRGSLATQHPTQHAMRSLSGAVALTLWFYALAKLPLALAMTLNYTASIWMVLFVIIGARIGRTQPVGRTLMSTVFIGFIGIVLILQPSIEGTQWWGSAVGLTGGLISAVAFMQVATLGKLGEPGYRVVFYFSLVGLFVGMITSYLEGGFSVPTYRSAMLVVAMGIVAAGAQWSLTYAFTAGRTLVNASLQYLTIAFSGIMGGLLFGERLSFIGIIGTGLVILAGVMASHVRERH